METSGIPHETSRTSRKLSNLQGIKSHIQLATHWLFVPPFSDLNKASIGRHGIPSIQDNEFLRHAGRITPGTPCDPQPVQGGLHQYKYFSSILEKKMSTKKRERSEETRLSSMSIVLNRPVDRQGHGQRLWNLLVPLFLFLRSETKIIITSVSFYIFDRPCFQHTDLFF